MSMNKTDSKHIRSIYHISQATYYINILLNRFGINDLNSYCKPVMSGAEGNDAIYELIMSGKPFAVARYGGTEARTIADVLYTMAGGKMGGLSNQTIERIVNLSGFFPKKKDLLYSFTDLYMESAQNIDLLAVWNVIFQTFLANDVTRNAKLGRLSMLEPYYFDAPWSRALKGKKVVVVHPFSKTIEEQYNKRSLLFKNMEILPDFELRTVKAVQTLAGAKDNRFASWFDALDYMFEEITSSEFDIALIGCGAYGFPLASRIKKAGKQAVHIGGALQVLFGIRGRRWDNSEFFVNLYNDNWVRPGGEDVLVGSEKVENSCYW